MEIPSSSADRQLTRDTFRAAGQARHKALSVTSRAWQSTVDMVKVVDHVLDGHSSVRRNAVALDMAQVLRGIRYMESGQHHMLLLGKTAWDIIAELNNHELPVDDPNYIIPWQDGIHTDLRAGQVRRQRAAERLQLAYHQLGELAAGDARPPAPEA